MAVRAALRGGARTNRRSRSGTPPFPGSDLRPAKIAPEGEELAAGDGATTMDLRRPSPLMGDAPRSDRQTPSRRRIRGVEAGSEPATVVAGDDGEGGAPNGPRDDEEPQGGGSARVEEQLRRDGTGRRPLRPGFVAAVAGVAHGVELGVDPTSGF